MKYKAIPFMSEQYLVSFKMRIACASPDECWKWMGALSPNGYGAVHFQGSMFLPHRMAFKIANNIDPVNHYVAHTCDNPPCCNPNHLFMATSKENAQDCIAKGRWADRKGESQSRCKLSEKDVLWIRSKYSLRELTYKQLAAIFKVQFSAIYGIVNRRTWKHI